MDEIKKKQKKKKYYYYKYHQNNRNYYYKKKKKNLIKDNGGIDNILLSSYEVPSDTIIYEEDIAPIKKTESKKRISLKTIFSLGFTCILLLVVILKTSYSFFTYQNNDNHADISVGEVYVKLIEETSNINLSNIYPKTLEEARNMDNNYFDFSIKAKNTSLTNVIVYNININNGENILGSQRINPEYIRVDLEEEINGEYYLLVDSMPLSEYSFMDTIPSDTKNEVIKKYRLRLWIGEDVIISDDDPHRSYTQEEYNNLYANFKVTIDAYDGKQ